MNSRLSPVGVEHALAQGRIMAPILAARPDLALFCSPLIRTRQTAARALAPRLGQIRYDARLMEVGMGDWEGRMHADIDAERAAAGGPATEGFAKYFHAPNGESFDALRNRARLFLDELQGPSVIVAHGIFNKVLRGLVLGLDAAGMEALDHRQGVVTHILDGRETRME